MDAIHLYGKSAVSFQLDSGGQRWYIVGCYLARNDASTIEDVVAAISQRLHGAALLLNGYLNTDLEAQEVRAREEKITSAMSMEGLKDISGHFLQRNKTWLRDGRMWSILRGGAGGALPDRIHHGNIPLYVPECGGPGRMVQNIPLLGSRLPPQNHAYRALTRPQEADTLSYQAPDDPRRCRLTVHRGPGRNYQSTLSGTLLPVMYLARNLASH